MAQNDSGSNLTFRDKLKSLADLGPYLALLTTGIVLFICIPTDSGTFVAPLIVTAGAAFGYAAGGYRGFLSNDWLTGRYKNLKPDDFKADDLKDLASSDYAEGIFVALCSLLMAAYLIFYIWAAINIADSGASQQPRLQPEFVLGGAAPESPADAAAASNSLPDVKAPIPIPWSVAIVTSITIFFVGFFTMRYAAYVRVTSLLEKVLARRPTSDSLVQTLRTAVFRDQQLHEPAGNIFVTVGIAATFTGLAVGLVLLDPSNFFSATNLSESEKKIRAAKALTSLVSFMACMGLALGVSMLGVMNALAAQWLRGHGASQCTEDLLTRSEMPNRVPGP